MDQEASARGVTGATGARGFGMPVVSLRKVGPSAKQTDAALPAATLSSPVLNDRPNRCARRRCSPAPLYALHSSAVLPADFPSGFFRKSHRRGDSCLARAKYAFYRRPAFHWRSRLRLSWRASRTTRLERRDRRRECYTDEPGDGVKRTAPDAQGATGSRLTPERMNWTTAAGLVPRGTEDVTVLTVGQQAVLKPEAGRT